METCVDCGGFDVEWMYHCEKCKAPYCPGCCCVFCEGDAWEMREEDGPMDLEDQLDSAFSRMQS